MSNITLKVLKPENQSEIQNFAKSKANPSNPFEEWSAPWREESLKHYLPQGWCLGAYEGPAENGQLCGYLLAQPILFWMKNTQTLWIEAVSANSQEIEDQLLQAAIGWSKDKHLQRVVMTNHNKGQAIQEQLFEVLTTRRSNHG